MTCAVLENRRRTVFAACSACTRRIARRVDSNACILLDDRAPARSKTSSSRRQIFRLRHLPGHLPLGYVFGKPAADDCSLFLDPMVDSETHFNSAFHFALFRTSVA